jgi:hypothetical protein
LSLEQFVVSAPDSLVKISVFSLLKVAKFSKAVDFLLIFAFLVLELVELEAEVVNVLSNGESLVTLLGDVSLSLVDLEVFSLDLVSGGCNVLLQVIVASILLVEEETQVVNFFFKLVHAHCIGVVLTLEVVVLQQLFVLEQSVLLLQLVELVTKGQVVFVSLLDFKDLSL